MGVQCKVLSPVTVLAPNGTSFPLGPHKELRATEKMRGPNGAQSKCRLCANRMWKFEDYFPFHKSREFQRVTNAFSVLIVYYFYYFVLDFSRFFFLLNISILIFETWKIIKKNLFLFRRILNIINALYAV